MNKFVRLVIVAPLFLLLACERVSFSSYLDVSQRFLIKGNKGESLQIDPGRVHIDLTVKNKKSMSIKINDSQKEEIAFSIPGSAHFPTERGTFFVSAQDLKQNFDLEGEIMTSYFDTPSISSTEVCEYPVSQQVCRTVGTQAVCTNETIYFKGVRTIVTHYEEKESHLILEFKDSEKSEVVAKFDGMHISHGRQLIDMYGECLIRH